MEQFPHQDSDKAAYILTDAGNWVKTRSFVAYFKQSFSKVLTKEPIDVGRNSKIGELLLDFNA